MNINKGKNGVEHMILKIAIADKNSEYIRRILNVLETYGDIDVSVFTDEKSLKGALDNRKFDVLLFDESIVQGIVIEKKDMLSILLLDENNGVDESFLNFKKIYKYQRVSKIYQQILEAYSEVCGGTGNIIGQKATSVVSFYSPIGGCGKTTLALIAATKYAIQGYQCLYLNLEEMGSQSFYLPQSDAKGLSEMAANLGENINFTMKLQSLIQKKQDRLYYLAQFQSPNDLYELSEDEEKELIDVICNTGLFDILVIDMGVSVNQKALALFELSDKIQVIEKPDVISMEKMKCFYRQSHIINAYGNKMTRTVNFYRGKDNIAETDIPIVGRINVTQNPDPTQFVEAMAKDSCTNYLLQMI